MEGPRAVTRDELPLLGELVSEACERPGNRLAALVPPAFPPEATTHLKAVFENGRLLGLVCHAPGQILLDGCPIQTAGLPAVLIHPDWRNQGLATLLLDDCLGQMRREGVRLVFTADRRGLYRRLGFHPAGIIWRAVLSNEQLPPAGQAALRVAADGEILPWLRRLYEREDPRFAEEAAPCSLADRAGPLGRPTGLVNHTCLAMQEGIPAAYTILGIADSGATSGRIVEYAGDRKALAGLLRQIMRRFGLDYLEMTLPGNDRPFLARLQAAGGTWEAQPMPGSLNLLNPIGLWQDLLPRLARRVGEATARRLTVTRGEDGAFGITLGQEALVLQDHERLLTLFFGRGAAPWPDRTLPQNLLRALSACFPLPLPWLPGLDQSPEPGGQGRPDQ